MNDYQAPDAVEQRVRQTLYTVAETITEDAFATTTQSSSTRRPRRRWRIGLGIGAIAIPLAVGAAAIVHTGPEYVDTISPERIVMSGSVDGSRYLLIESDRINNCGRPIQGVELVEQSKNPIGSEWNTTGYEYGESVEKRCGVVNDTARYLEHPALFDASGVEVGDSFVWIYAVHPDVDTVRITSGAYTEDLKVYEVDGAGYAPFEIPKDMDHYTSELVIDGRVVPGSKEMRHVPRT